MIWTLWLRHGRRILPWLGAGVVLLVQVRILPCLDASVKGVPALLPDSVLQGLLCAVMFLMGMLASSRFESQAWARSVEWCGVRGLTWGLIVAGFFYQTVFNIGRFSVSPVSLRVPSEAVIVIFGVVWLMSFTALVQARLRPHRIPS